MEKLYIIDAVNYLFRSYYAIGPMTNPNGESVSALYGFIRSVQKLIKDFSPSHMIAVFDGPDNSASRRELYADYKAHRKKAPEDLFPQFSLAENFCKMAGIPTICVPQVEADDTMATIATWAEKQGSNVYLCTSDKDLMQIVTESVFVLQTYKNNLHIDPSKVKEIYGVGPHQMRDYLAIMGDTSDNIPGLEGFGPKTATTLLQQFGTLDEILAHPEKVAGKKKQQTLVEQKEIALLSRELATLNLNVPFPKEKSFFKLQTPDLQKLKIFYQQMRFLTLLKDLSPVQQELDFGTSDKKSKEDQEPSYELIKDSKSLEQLFALLTKEKEICIDTETTSIHPLEAEIVGIGFCARTAEAYYIPFNGALPKQEILDFLKRLFTYEGITFIGHNIKYDLHILNNLALPLPTVGFDTMLASYLLTPHHRRHNLDQLTLIEFEKQKISIKTLLGEGKKQRLMSEVPLEKVSEYCCEDVDYTYRLKQRYEKRLKQQDLHELFIDIEIPLLKLLQKMEKAGIYLNLDKLSSMSISLTEKLIELELAIHEEIGEKFNLKSPKQLSAVLYDRLGLTPPKKKTTAYATGANVLESLVEQAPVVSKILEYRALDKLLSTYINALPAQVNSKTHRIHCTFNQSVAATGRLSCQDPNLQNIPVRTQEGRKIREGFEPQKQGWSYLSADYSQIELRLLAHYCNDPQLIGAFKEGKDIHAHTASLVFGVPLDQVTKEMRSQAKTVNFGILYGQGAYGLAQELGITNREAAEFIKRYFERYPSIATYLESKKEEATKNGYAQTLTRRKRPIPELDSKNPILRSHAQRLAINTPLQGTAADIIKIAMLQIETELKTGTSKGYLILQIHDELIFEVPDEELPQFQQLVKTKMENAYPLQVPLTVDIAIGKNWGEC